MLASCQGHRRRAAGGRGERSAWCAPTLLALPALGGCTDLPGGSAAWSFVALALLLVAVGGHALGALRARRDGDQALREASASGRHLTDLHEAWLWQTDAQHALVSWRGPAQAALTTCPLFADPLLQARLRAQTAFADLHLELASPLEGKLSWQLRAVPRFDERGGFAGYIGSARPTDDADAEHAAAAALQPLLGTHTMPALLATESGGAWRVLAFNSAARALWPTLVAGCALADTRAALPAATATALDLAMSGATAAPAEAEAWSIVPYGAAPARGLVLVRLNTAAGGADDAAQVAESDTFSFTVTHDLRAPIRVVDGFTRIVKEDYGRLLDRVGNDHLDRVLGAAARMNLMIDALLTLARLSSQPLARQPVNLSQLAAYVIDDLRRAAPEREADIDIEPGLGAQGDPTLLRLVLENLLGNAWKYSARCTRSQVSLHAVPHGAGTAFVVRDNGAGFDMRSADRLFGLFQRLHSASEFPGHGVGLASVRRIVRRHGGQIWAEAEPGRGAAFYFTLAA